MGRKRFLPGQRRRRRGSITAENRVAMTSELLGITRWKPRKGSTPAGAFSPDTEQPGNHPVTEEAPHPWQRIRHQEPPQNAGIDVALWLTHPVPTPSWRRLSARAPRTGRPGQPRWRPDPDRKARQLRRQIRARAPARKPITGPEGYVAKRPQSPQMGFTEPGHTRNGPDGRAGAVAYRAGTAGEKTVAHPLGGCHRQHRCTDHGGGHHSNRHNRDAAVTAGSLPAGHYAPVTLNAGNSVTMGPWMSPRRSSTCMRDFQCPVCRAFEEADGAVLQQLTDQGKVKVVHPFTIFSGQPQQANSIRARAAAKCVPASL
jgi:hypothetical protein